MKGQSFTKINLAFMRMAIKKPAYYGGSFHLIVNNWNCSGVPLKFNPGD
jgi:hypothetical protein